MGKSNKRVFYAPENISIRHQQNLVFLAGPIQGAPNWHDEAIDLILNGSKDIIIASPKRPKGIVKTDFNYTEQVDWETDNLAISGFIGRGVIFWLPKEDHVIEGRSYAQTSRFEIGEWYSHYMNDYKIPLYIGIEPGFIGERYIREKFKNFNIQIHDTLEDTINDVLDVENKLRNS